eukprot:4491258-Pyramimonas_sp.AAC.1
MPNLESSDVHRFHHSSSGSLKWGLDGVARVIFHSISYPCALPRHFLASPAGSSWCAIVASSTAWTHRP